MAVQKLSQITASANNPLRTDEFVAVTGGNTDVLYTLNQIGQVIGLSPAPGNLDFYVATTGSDSNPGTLAQPFLTPQHAAIVASTFDYQGTFTVTVHIAAGTYPQSGSVILPPCVNTLGTAPALMVGAGHNLTTLKNTGGPSARVVIHVKGDSSEWIIQDLGIDGQGGGVSATDGGFLHHAGTIDFFDSVGGGGVGITIFGSGNNGKIEVFFSTININYPTNGFTDFFQDTGPIFIMDLFSTTLNFLGTTLGPSQGFENWIDTQANNGGGSYTQESITFTGISGANFGNRLLTSVSGGDVFIGTDNGTLADILPGQTPTNPEINTDNANYLYSLLHTGTSGTFFTFGTPPLNAFIVAKDGNAPTGAGVDIRVNDGGTKFGLRGGAPYKVSAPTTGSTVTSSYGLRSNIIAPTGTLSTLTVNLPTGMSDGDITRISFTQAITTLTIATTDSSTIVGAPTTAAAGSAFQFLYKASGTTWYIN